jgi:hypothetical protein
MRQSHILHEQLGGFGAPALRLVEHQGDMLPWPMVAPLAEPGGSVK